MYALYCVRFVYNVCVHCAGLCSVATQMHSLVDVCRVAYSMQDEDTANYDVGWTDLPESTDNSTQVYSLQF